MKIVISAAGSGGHIYPALSLAKHLKERYSAEVVFFSTKKALGRKIFNSSGYSVITTGLRSFSSRERQNLLIFLLKNFYFLIQFISEGVRTVFLLWKIKPEVVVGFGGISSIPAVLGARLLNIPTLIHEQNVVPGLANQCLSCFSTKIAVSFRKSSKYFKHREVLFTGNPVRYDLKRIEKDKARSLLGVHGSKFTLLIFGGSQGSEYINKVCVALVAQLSDVQKNQLQVIHISGDKDTESIKQGYTAAKVTAKVFSYIEDMSPLYCAADLIICRAGAGTLNEIKFFAKASILIPYPYAHAHQIANAEIMLEEKAAFVAIQDESLPDVLKDFIGAGMKDPMLLEKLAGQAYRLSSDSAVDLLAGLVKELADRKKY
ncbi:MAG: undecaprenyldiphospho-muramoylpentapeptide beta-N-acetylglucosaminyltransferase [Candidatus Omnitrophota bacterium]